MTKNIGYIHYKNIKLNLHKFIILFINIKMFDSTLSKILFLCIYIAIMTTLIFFKIKSNKENYRLLEITPSKKCVLGPYTWGKPDSALYKFCSSPEVQQEVARQTCPHGFYGVPVNWNYTPESDDKWKNRRCNCFMDDYEKVPNNKVNNLLCSDKWDPTSVL